MNEPQLFRYGHTTCIILSVRALTWGNMTKCMTKTQLVLKLSETRVTKFLSQN